MPQERLRLVGGHRLWFNAFFVRNGVGDAILPEVSAEECLRAIDMRFRDAALEILSNREFVEV
jgi:hypothetical protein